MLADGGFLCPVRSSPARPLPLVLAARPAPVYRAWSRRRPPFSSSRRSCRSAVGSASTYEHSRVRPARLRSAPSRPCRRRLRSSRSSSPPVADVRARDRKVPRGTPFQRPDRGGTDRRAGEVQRIGPAQLVQRYLAQALPHSGGVPLLQRPPAGRPGAETRLRGQVLPGDAGVQDEQDALEGLAVIEPLPPGMPETALGSGKQGLDPGPELVIDIPRPRPGRRTPSRSSPPG